MSLHCLSGELVICSHKKQEAGEPPSYKTLQLDSLMDWVHLEKLLAMSKCVRSYYALCFPGTENIPSLSWILISQLYPYGN